MNLEIGKLWVENGYAFGIRKRIFNTEDAEEEHHSPGMLRASRGRGGEEPKSTAKNGSATGTR
jgi:hypothetical protein